MIARRRKIKKRLPRLWEVIYFLEKLLLTLKILSLIEAEHFLTIVHFSVIFMNICSSKIFSELTKKKAFVFDKSNKMTSLNTRWWRTQNTNGSKISPPGLLDFNIGKKTGNQIYLLSLGTIDYSTQRNAREDAYWVTL